MEISKQVADKVYELIELSRTTGKIKKGTNEVTKVVERGQAKIVVTAQDISPPEIVMHLPALCEEKKIPFVIVPKKEDLGAAAGLGVSTAAIAVIDAGEGKKLLQDVVDEIKVSEK